MRETVAPFDFERRTERWSTLHRALAFPFVPVKFAALATLREELARRARLPDVRVMPFPLASGLGIFQASSPNTIRHR
jgi:hypothetical protein